MNGLLLKYYITHFLAPNLALGGLPVVVLTKLQGEKEILLLIIFFILTNLVNSLNI